MADARQQIAAGARHITFGDPDFLNGPTHALRVARALNQSEKTVANFVGKPVRAGACITRASRADIIHLFKRCPT